MSFEDKDENDQWQPTITEITELLQQLQLSPPHSDCEIISQHDSSVGSRHTQSESDESSRTTTIIDELDRQAMLEQLEGVSKQKRINKMKNNWFHEYLVEHFTRKQMIHVCSDKPEDDSLLNDYLKLLRQLNRQKKKTKLNEETWNEELEQMRFRVLEENNQAEEIVHSMVTREKNIGVSITPRRRQQAMRNLQCLITKQTERIKKTKLRNKLDMIESNLETIISSRPNLSKNDYERLEAEQFYYQRQLDSKTIHRVTLMEKENYLQQTINAIQLQISHIREDVEHEKQTISALRRTKKNYLTSNRNLINKIRYNRNMIQSCQETVMRCKTKEYKLNMEKNYREYEEWMKKISKLLKQIKRLGQSLSALRTNLILHGKNIELSPTDDIELLEKIVDKSSLERRSPLSE